METYSPIAVLVGRASGLTEPRRIGCEFDSPTKGHSSAHPGLRGHSIGDVYPWRVIGLGSGWAVESSRGEIAARYYGFQACEAAHARARSLKQLYPAGHTGT